jgi:lysophospholipase L1-like esterase
MTVFVALGDSITAGMGDPAPGGGWRGWAALLAATLDQPDLHNLATLGALAADVEHLQLPAAVAAKPDVASVVVGINDTLRGDFDPERTGASVGRTVAALRAVGAEVLTMRLPDPGQMFGLPGALARPLARRMHAMNAAVDQVASRPAIRLPTNAVTGAWTGCIRTNAGTASSRAASTTCWPRRAIPSAKAPTRSLQVRRRPGARSSAGWPPREPPGCSGAPATWCRRW